MPVDGVLDAVDLCRASPAGPRRAAWRARASTPRRCRCRRAGSSTVATVPSRFVSTSIGCVHLAGGERRALELGDRLLDVRGVDVVGLDRDDGRARAAGEGVDELLERLDRRARDALDARSATVCSWSAGSGQGDAAPRRRRRAETTGRRSTRSRTAPQSGSRSLRARRPRNGMRPFSTLSPSRPRIAGRTVSEPIIATRRRSSCRPRRT